MSFLHKRMQLNFGDIVEVDCSHQCNIMIMSDSNFSNYKRGSRFQYYGGHYTHLPARITVPSSGSWNVVLDIGGRAATIRHSINIIPA
ncbi:DUF1883 domain-containing protein [Serratia nematodiphila]|uniref:DUF1883 domain-containing protein n=1 Tax=Serratia nematodiphila TaxID=458197 RepID=UPI0011D82701|nr:DUF1883 domain-containing protein [Serratia nematodiphila]TXE58996.1 DUF1883 domain-containing protein [Serratia nematodiphila]